MYVFSVDNISSYMNVLEKWVPEIRQFCIRTSILLVATKTDLRYDDLTQRKMARKGRSLITTMQGLTLAHKVQVCIFEVFPIRTTLQINLAVYLTLLIPMQFVTSYQTPIWNTHCMFEVVFYSVLPFTKNYLLILIFWKLWLHIDTNTTGKVYQLRTMRRITYQLIHFFLE